MRALVLLPLSLLAVAHADVLIRSEEPNAVPGLHHETFYVVDDSPEARSADGGSPVKSVMTHTSASGPRALAALFGPSDDSGLWSSWMDQQIGTLGSVHRALMPAVLDAPPRRTGCLKHKKAMAAAAANDDAVPRSYSSLDEELLQRMAAARLTPQLLSLLMASADQDGQDIIVAVGPQEDRPRPQVAFTDSNGVLSFGGGASDGAAFDDGPHTAEPRSVLAVEICDETGCTVQYQGDEPRASQVQYLPAGRIFDVGPGAWANDAAGAVASAIGGERRVSFDDMAAERGAFPSSSSAMPSGGFHVAWQSAQRDGNELSPLNPGLVLFVILCAACIFVWARLAILCCALRRCGAARRRYRCHRRGHKQAALLEPLAPEAAAAPDSLAIYTDVLCPPPKGLHPPVQPVRPYAVQVAAEHTAPAPQGSAYVTIQYVPLQSEGANKA